MNPLYIDSQRVGLGVDGFDLYVKDLKTGKLIERFEPRDIPYDSIFIQRPNGFVSFAALNWLEKHTVSLTVIDWKGNVLAQFLPEEPVSNELRIAQVRAHLDPEKRLSIARRIVETKLKRQSELLRSLSESYPFVKVLQAPVITSGDGVLLRNQEARFAEEYFTQFGAICKELGFRFRGRKCDRRIIMNAGDLVNGLLNYGYGFLKSYVRRTLTSVGLDNTIPFMHELRNKRSLVFDVMELWRTNVDYSVLLCLSELRRERITHRLTDDYTVLLDPETIRILFDKLKLNLSLEELIINSRILAKHILGQRKELEFSLKPVRTDSLSEPSRVKETILTKNASQLRMNKSTLWYMKRRLERTGSIRLYSKTKHHFP
jgi:CRISPR-associated protein Cas1